MTRFRDTLFNNVDYIALDSKQKTSLIQKMSNEIGISSIVDEITEILKSNVEKEIYIVSLFLRDVCIKRQNGEINTFFESYRATIQKSNIFELMNKNLYSTDRLIRETTYRTFGLTCFAQNAHYLKEASKYYKIHFPDQLEALEFEHKWLIDNQIYYSDRFEHPSLVPAARNRT